MVIYMVTQSIIDLKRIPSEDGKRANDRFRCTVCIGYGSDDKLKMFTPNNKNAHLKTIKHQASLGIRMCRLEERRLAQEQTEHAQLANAVLLPLPEMPSLLPTSPDDETSALFTNFCRLGLAYLDENGEELEFSAGTDVDNEGVQTQTEDDETFRSDDSDSENDVAGPQTEQWAAWDAGLGDYWPYPSKVVSGKLCSHQLPWHLHGNCPDADAGHSR